jgi:hypothetical protein
LVVNATPQRISPRERPGTHCAGGWEGLRTGLDIYIYIYVCVCVCVCHIYEGKSENKVPHFIATK